MGFSPGGGDRGKLTDLKVTTASYGAAMNYGYATTRYDNTVCIFADPLREVKRKRRTKAGKYNEYTYFGTFAIAVCDYQVDAITRIWLDRKLVYDSSGTGPITLITSTVGSGKSTSTVSKPVSHYARFYLGTETQLPDARMEAILDTRIGAGSCPAYRGVTYIFFDDLPLEKLGNHLPQVSVEVVTNGTPNYPYETKSVPIGQPHLLYGFTYSQDYSRLMWNSGQSFAIFDVSARSQIITGTLDNSLGLIAGAPAEQFGIDSNGYIWAVTAQFSFVGDTLVRYPPDGLGAPTNKGALPTYLGLAGGSSGVQAFATSVGEDLICITPYANQPLVMFYGPGSFGAVAGVNTHSLRTGGFTPSMYFQDLDGGVWCIGGPPNGSFYCFYRIFRPSSSPVVGDYFEVPTGTTFGLIPKVSACHYRDATHDHFVVGNTDNSQLVIIDLATLAVTTTVTHALSSYTADNQFRLLPQGSRSIWINFDEVSLADLSTIRSLNPANWKSEDTEGSVYDPINHAIISAPNGVQVLTWRYLDRISGAGIQLSDVVDDISIRCGLQSGDWDASDLDQTVLGYSWTQASGSEVLERLLEAYDSEVRPHDFAIEFLKRGAASLGTIPVTELVGKPRYEIEEANDGDLPLVITTTFADTARDGQANTAMARRPISTNDSQRQDSLDLPTWRADVTSARVAVEGYLRRTWFTSETVKASGSRLYTKWEPGDAYTLTLDDISRKLKIRRLEFSGNGVLNVEWMRYEPAIHVASGLAGAPASGMTPATITVTSYTKGIVLDIPLIVDADDALIVYLAAAPYDPSVSWPGADFLVSDDGVAAYGTVFGSVSSTEEAIMGTASTALPDALTSVIDYGNTVTVVLLDGSLTSCTELEMLNGSNRAILGDEVIGFTTATLTGALTYDLSGLLRGRRGTEWATAAHLAGDRFVLLESVLPQVTMGASEVGDTDYYQAVTSGGSSGFIQALPFAGLAKKPYSPTHLTVTASGGDKVLAWVRRTRIGADALYGTTPPLGETTEAYEVDVLNGAGAVIRTITGLTTPTCTYTSAQQSTDSGAGTDVNVYQISSTVGRGYAATASL